jgi:hypothetical protein
LLSIDSENRQLIADDGSTVMLDWSDPLEMVLGTLRAVGATDGVAILGQVEGFNPAVSGSNTTIGDGVTGYSVDGNGIAGESVNGYGVVAYTGGFNDAASAGYFSNGGAAEFPSGAITNSLYWYDGTYTPQIIDLSYGLLNSYAGFGASYPSVDWNNRQLIRGDGTTVLLDWSDPSGYGIINVNGNHFMNVDNLADASDVPSLYVNNRLAVDGANSYSIDWSYRQLIGNDSYTIVMDWSDGTARFVADGSGGFYFGIDGSGFYGPSGYWDGSTFTSSQNFQLGIDDASDLASINPNDRQLYAPDGSTVIAQWGNGYTFEANQIYGIGGSLGIDFANAALMDGSAPMLSWASGYLTTDYQFATTSYIDASLGYVSSGYAPALLPYGSTFAPTAVASLVGNEGTIAYVNDADTPVIGLAVVGGASAKCLVCYNGTDWIVTSLL